ncbi:hypothetical protein EON81_11850 [bacterium]|nr:MAG: hypothetical protein EON81_11850 [bacterium]
MPTENPIWRLGRGEDPSAWVEAAVPGAVQLDWARAEGCPPLIEGDNHKAYVGLEDDVWTYATTLPAMAGPAFLTLTGVDYAYRVFFEGEEIYRQVGMFTPATLDLTGRLDAPRELRVILEPAPKDSTAPIPRRESRRSTKPAVSYGWDFHPRLIPLGIWDDVCLTSEAPWAPEVTYRLSEDLQQAHLTFHGASEWTILDPSGVVVLETNEVEVTLEKPILWWPHDQGEPNRYTIEARSEGRSKRFSVGFRRVQLVMHEDAWNWPDGFPKTRSNPPITLEINGRNVFAKGSNWVSPDIFPGTLTAERYREQLELAKRANMNMLRMWGGAIVQKESFYDLCDELGIMVWQEFPLACNLYPDDDEYLDTLEFEARSIVGRLRRHPSVVLWCGGNELFNGWSCMTDQSHPLRLLDAICYEMDRRTPFLPTSPVMGMGHGGYTFRDPRTDEECWSSFQRSSNTAYTEFGCGGIASVETLQSFLPPDEEFPPRPGTAWEDHHAYSAWIGDTWLDMGTIEHYFGPSSSLEELVAKGQVLQAEGFRGLFEEARRQKPRCAMALNWCFNEPWPTAANNSLIEWPCKPKPALYAVGEACRPSLASARISKFMWKEGEWFDPEFWILHDAPVPLAGGTLVASVGGTVLLRWDFDEIPANENLRGPRGALKLPRFEGDRFTMEVRVEGRPDLATTYTFAYRADESLRVVQDRKLND